MEIVIRPKNRWWELDWKEIWDFRDLFYFLAWRDVKVKYKQTIVGGAWAVFQPLASMVIFTVFFGRLAKLPSDGIPYPIFVYTGLVFWQLFSGGLTAISMSFINNENIVTKIFFPRIILPVSAIITNLVDFAIAAVILFGLMVWYGYQPSLLGLLMFLPLVVMTSLAALGIGLLFASLNVKYRDVRHVLPFFMQMLIFITPVIYPVSLVSAKYRWILGLNPMSGVISLARTSLLGVGTVDWVLTAVSVVSLLLYGVFGYAYFKKVERYFADVI